MNTMMMQVADIIPADYNPRVALTPSEHEYKALKDSVDQFGLVVPLIVNKRTNTLVSGHQRLSVLQAAGVEKTEVMVIDVDEDAEKALCIGLNKIEGQWDYGKLAELIKEVNESSTIDMSVTGFSKSEIDEILGQMEEFVPADVPEAEPESDLDDVKCSVGNYNFSITPEQYDRLVCEARLEVGWNKGLISGYVKERVLRED